MNTCIYLRKSRKGDDPSETAAETLRRHREQLLALAQERGLEVTEIKEEIVSGGSIAARPQMRALLSEVEEGRYDAVLVMDIDRLGRGSMIDQGIIGRAFRESETLVITPDKTYDLSDDADEDYYDFYALFARKELKQIKKRLKRGKMKSFREGNFVWSRPPYGYVKSGKNSISPDPPRADTVRLIFRQYLGGMSMGQIASALNESGVRTGNGCLWSHKTISSILRNREYAGDVVCGKTKIVRGKAVKQPPEKWICLPGRHEAIVSPEEFRRVQERLALLPACRTRRGMSLKNPLAGVFICGFCGAPMMRKSGGDAGKERLRCSRSCPDSSSVLLDEAEMRYLDTVFRCLFPRMRSLSFPASDSGRRQRYKVTDPSVLIRLILRADPVERNAFYRSITEKCEYIRSRREPEKGFQLRIFLRF